MSGDCPICGDVLLEIDDEFICYKCGSAFVFEYLGMYKDGSSERIDEGFEPQEFKNKYGKKIAKFMAGRK